MKKYLALLLVMILCLSMMACGGEEQTNDNYLQEETVDSNTQGEKTMGKRNNVFIF